MKTLITALFSIGIFTTSSVPCSILHEYKLVPKLETIVVTGTVERLQRSETLRNEIDTKEIFLKIKKRIQYPDLGPEHLLIQLKTYQADCKMVFVSSAQIQERIKINSEIMLIGRIEEFDSKGRIIVQADDNSISENNFQNQLIFTDGSTQNFENVFDRMQKCKRDKLENCYRFLEAIDVVLAAQVLELSRTTSIATKKNIFLTIARFDLFPRRKIDSAIQIYFSDPKLRRELKVLLDEKEKKYIEQQEKLRRKH